MSRKSYCFCSCCGRNLTDPISISLGIGPICRVKQKTDDMNQGDIFSPRASYDWKIDGNIISIIDLKKGKSVTNDIDNILSDIQKELGLQNPLSNFKIIYKDTYEVWDGIQVSSNGHCSGFYSINEKEYQNAKAKLINQ